jgi:hypothetical protein
VKSATVPRFCAAQAVPAEPHAGPTIGTTETPLGAAQSLFSNLLEQTIDLFASDGERARTQRDALLAFTVRVLSAALLYLTQIVLARWMGGSEYGIYVAVWTWVLILGAMSHLGLNLASIPWRLSIVRAVTTSICAV